MDKKDPIHDYILKANSEDLKDMLAAAGLDPKSEVAWIDKILQKHLDKPDESIEAETSSAISNLSFGTFLRLLRHQRKLEIDDLAQKAKIEAKEIVRIETEPEYRPRPRTVSQLALFFDIPVDKMSMLSGLKTEIPNELREESVRFAANAKQVAGLPKEEMKLIRDFVSILCKKK
jgi:transcriptional regulator with XRE-family HTH domain